MSPREYSSAVTVPDDAKVPGSPILEIASLSMRYPAKRGRGTEVLALTDVTLDVAPGEFIAIVGRSGCGKSTLLRIVAGLTRGAEGSVKLGGQDVDGPRAEVGMVFQTPVLFPWRTVLQNVLLPRLVDGSCGPDDRARAVKLLNDVGLGDFRDHYPFQLSGGMQQRASIVRALIRDPPVLLMDEPFGAVDALTREDLNRQLQELWLGAGKTILFVTHSIAEAVFLGDRVVVLSDRPGTIKGITRIELPRPREIGVMSSTVFGRYVREVRGLLGASG